MNQLQENSLHTYDVTLHVVISYLLGLNIKMIHKIFLFILDLTVDAELCYKGTPSRITAATVKFSYSPLSHVL